MARKTARPKIVAAKLTAVIRHDADFVGRTIFGRKGTAFENFSGEITGTSLCRLEGCRGTRLHVRWQDGKRTYPCSKGCDLQKDGSLRIA